MRVFVHEGVVKIERLAEVYKPVVFADVSLLVLDLGNLGLDQGDFLGNLVDVLVGFFFLGLLAFHFLLVLFYTAKAVVELDLQLGELLL